MASLLAPAMPRLLTADEFLQIDSGPDLKAELNNGLIRMMAGGSRLHALVQGNLRLALGVRLRGSGYRPYEPDMAIRPHGMSVRYPNVTVDCGGADDTDEDLELSEPKVVGRIRYSVTMF